MKVGFIGLGVMGVPMAEHLAAAGHEMFLHSRSGVPDGMAGTPCDSPAEVATKADAIILMLPDTQDVQDVLLGREGIVPALTAGPEPDDGVLHEGEPGGLGAGKMVIDMSSISPWMTKEFAEHVGSTGASYLDAPVSGGQVGARQASLTIMVGGSEEAFARAKPLFEAMGKNITLMGPVGAGQTTKVANQIIVALTIEAVAEGLLFAARSGVDAALVRQALTGGLATSRILELHGERMIKRTFQPGFRIELHQKDLNLALQEGRRVGLSLPGTANAQELFNACAAHGGKTWDHSAMVRALEGMADFEIGQEAGS
jgi:2-hydroxy-3-oxopropionate reductase